MIDMKVNYLGLKLDHPLIVGASPQADSLDGVRRAEDGSADGARVTADNLHVGTR